MSEFLSLNRIKSHQVRASPDAPQFIVETEDGKRASHKAAALKKG